MDTVIFILMYLTAIASGYILGYTRYHSWFMKNIIGKGHREGGPCETEKHEPKVTYDDDGTVHIDRLDPGQEVKLDITKMLKKKK